jgi:hypothetical protein
MPDATPEPGTRDERLGAIALPRTYPERRVRPPMRLRAGARSRVRAVAEVVAPSRPLGFDPGEVAIDFLERYLPYLPPLLGRLFPLGLLLIDWMPLVTIGALSRASRLAPAARRRHYEALGHSRFSIVRETWVAVRGLVACAIYRTKEMHALLGYAPQPYQDDLVRFRREKFGAPEQW